MTPDYIVVTLQVESVVSHVVKPTCEAAGYFTISDPTECSAAVVSVYGSLDNCPVGKEGKCLDAEDCWPGSFLKLYDCSYSDRPVGCTKHRDHDNVALWTNGEMECGRNGYDCICKTIAAPTEAPTSTATPTFPSQAREGQSPSPQAALPDDEAGEGEDGDDDDDWPSLFRRWLFGLGMVVLGCTFCAFALHYCYLLSSLRTLKQQVGALRSSLPGPGECSRSARALGQNSIENLKNLF